MRFFTYSNLLISSLLLTSVKAYDDYYTREVDYTGIFARGEEVYNHFQRRSDFVSDLTTRELVEELEDRLFRRMLSPEEQLAEARRKGVPLTLTLDPDRVHLEAFKKLAEAIISPTADHHASNPPSPGPSREKAATPIADKHEAPPRSPVRKDSTSGKV